MTKTPIDTNPAKLSWWQLVLVVFSQNDWCFLKPRKEFRPSKTSKTDLENLETVKITNLGTPGREPRRTGEQSMNL